MQRVIKRDGREVEFDKSKIIKAISHANQEIIKSKQIGSRKINQLASIVEEKCKEYKRAIKVEDINDIIEDELISRNYNDLVRTFIRYRYNKELVRKSNTTDDSILSLINLSNEELKQENSNKNPVVNSTQRDYMAGEVSKDLTKRLLLPKEVVKAHEDGILHFHDMDYFAQKMYNCFHSKTRFITSRGVRAFTDCSDGEELLVLTKDGEWKPATVRRYGKREMQNVTLAAGKTRKTIKCTSDHRWVLSDGSITTKLSVGDTLFALREASPIISNPDAFCLGFILGDGTDLISQTSSGVKVRLCGEKIKYLDTFIKAGYRVSNSKHTNGDVCVTKLGAISKSEFITARCWNYLSMEDKISLFLGYYAADGARDTNRLATSNEYLAQMIRDISALAGYHIISENTIIHDTNYKKDAMLFKFHFMKHQQPNHLWKVESIEPDRHGPVFDAWCVEEPSTHTFTLDGGIVTGNCCLINLEDMLQNGTVVSGTLIEKPHSFATACNIATQIIAQVSSNQYGGQSITLSHLAPFVDVSRQKIRKEVIEEFNMVGLDAEAKINAITERRVRAEVKRGVQTIQYQVNTLLTTNGQAPFITVFMYLNEVEDEQTRKDLAMIIEEVLLQRYEGVKNEKGVWITPAFPKLIYVLEEDNIREGTDYWYLTKLAAKCSAKRLVPDYISEKVMKELKEGGCFPPMGCRSMLSVWYDETVIQPDEDFELLG